MQPINTVPNQSGTILHKCQRFTPKKLTTEMLDLAEYSPGKKIAGKRFLEHSFGQGDILVPAVENYIQDALCQGMSKEEISTALSNDIYGFELDEGLFQYTLERLQGLLDKYQIPNVVWNLQKTDALKWTSPVSFDYIIGNPPYITYSEIDHENQQFLRENYASCKTGKFDYYYAFLELSVKCLNPGGIMVQLIPNNLYKNVYAKELRQMLLPFIQTIYLYPNQQLFQDTLTSVSILSLKAGMSTDHLVCENKTDGKKYQILKSELGEKWIFDSRPSSDSKVRFGDYFHASNAVATLCNNAYLLTEDETGTIERELCLPAASPKSLFLQKKVFILFPYQVTSTGSLRIPKEKFERDYPLATAHLRKYVNELQARKADKNATWYEYGRGQALQHIHQKKLLMPSVITKSVSVYALDEHTIPYTGIFITSKSDSNLELAKRILQSKDFLSYVNRIGIYMHGKSLRITCQDINNYMFSNKELY